MRAKKHYEFEFTRADITKVLINFSKRIAKAKVYKDYTLNPTCYTDEIFKKNVIGMTEYIYHTYFRTWKIGFNKKGEYVLLIDNISVFDLCKNYLYNCLGKDWTTGCVSFEERYINIEPLSIN